MKTIVLFVGLTLACSARADLGPPYVTPANATSSDTVVLHALQDACNVLNTGLIAPQVVESDGSVDVLVTGDHETDPEFCIYGSGVANVPIGMFPPAIYIMHITWQYPGLGGTLQQQSLGDVAFEVVGDESAGTIRSAPTIGPIGAGILFGVLCGVAWWTRRRPNAANPPSSSSDSPAGPTD